MGRPPHHTTMDAAADNRDVRRRDPTRKRERDNSDNERPFNEQPYGRARVINFVSVSPLLHRIGADQRDSLGSWPPVSSRTYIIVGAQNEIIKNPNVCIVPV